MTSLRSRVAALVLAASVLPAISAEPPGATTPGEIPVETLFKQPAVAQVSYSPDGRHIACLQPYKRRLNIVVADTATLKPVLVTGFEDQDVAGFSWANNERLVFSMDTDGDEGFGLFAVNRDGTQPTVLVPTVADQLKAGSHNPRSFSILGRVPGDSRHIVATCHDSGSSTQLGNSEVVLVDLLNGSRRTIASGIDKVRAWLVDRAAVVRIAITENAGRVTVLHRASASAKWEPLISFDEDEPGWLPLGFDGDNRTLFVTSTLGRKTTAVCRFDTATKQMGDAVVSDEVYDTFDFAGQLDATMIYSESHHKVLGFVYQAAKPRVHWLDSKFALYQQVVDRSMPQTFNRLLELSGDGQHLLIYARSDREPGVYYLLDLERKKIREFAVVRPDIDPAAMAPMRPIEFRARDGRRIHGYLTLPVGGADRKNALIVHPHGGPYGIRDEWGYNPEVQFYASRGCAVLQINFRGSGGYGFEFERAGYHQWGLQMQDDLSDGVRWAIEQGFADPARVAICGASYGGYATMAGLTFTPELYCAGVNYVGVTDLLLLAERYDENNDMRRWFAVHIGTVGSDQQRLLDTSPVRFADRVRVPVLMGYGYNDPRVPIEHGSSMAAAMKKAGKAAEIIYEKKEGHGFRKEENRIDWYRAVDAFLKTNVVAPQRFVVREGELKVIEMPAKERAEK